MSPPMWRRLRRRAPRRSSVAGVTETIDVGGMHCGGCEQRLRDALLAVPGVTGAVAEHIGDLVDVTFDPEQVDLAHIRRAIVAAGFVA
jgi:copper chaperone CopZ